MAPSKKAKGAGKVKAKLGSKEKRLNVKTKSLKSSTKTTNASCSTKSKSKKKEAEPTGGLELLKRHAVTMSSITKYKRKGKRVVLFNRRGTPYGKVAKKMKSYLGVLARRRVPIIRETWKKATIEEKDKIWKRLTILFEIREENRKKIMQSASCKWREFKSRLTSKYIIPYLNDPEKLKYPPNDYAFIPPDHWTLFVKSRTTPAFLEKREIQQKRRKKNKYQHTMSRKGYIGVEEEMIEELGEDLIPGEGEIDRDLTWVRGHVPKDGEIKDEETKKAVEKIGVIRKEVDEGVRQVEGKNDILAQALETPEHSSRVRGVGGHITPHEYFGLPNLRKQSFDARMRRIVQEESQKIVEEAKPAILAEAKAQLMEEVRAAVIAEEEKRWAAKFAEYAAANGLDGGKLHTPLSGQGSTHTMDGAASVPKMAPEITRQKALFKEKEVEVPEPIVKKDDPNPFPKKKVQNAVNLVARNFAAAEARKNKASASIAAPEEKKSSESVTLEENKFEESVNSPKKKQRTYRVGDPEIECKLAVGSVDNIVAYATVIEAGDDHDAVIHGRPLGADNRRVSVYNAIDENAKVPFPVEGCIDTVKQAMGSWVAWPKDLIIFSTEKPVETPKVSKKKRKRTELDIEEEADMDLPELATMLSGPYQTLCTALLRANRDLKLHYEPEVFGYACTGYITATDLARVALMGKITGNCIASYQRCLYSKLEGYKMLHMVAFVHPSQIGAVGCGTGIERTEHIANRLAAAKPGQLFMLPYNSGDHWTLTIIDPDNDIAYFMDPVRRRIPCGDWPSIVKSAMVKANNARKRKGRSSIVMKNLAGLPFQLGNKECGFYVMRYMREIIEDKDTSQFVTKWDKRGNGEYARADFDEVRDEWAEFAVKQFVKEP